MNRGAIVLGIALAAAAAVLQSTVLRFVAIAGVQPDIVLIILIYVAHRNGSMVGQLAGLGAGIVLDVVGLSPLGFYTLIYTLIAFLYGVTRGKMFVDAFLLPVLMAIVALILKGLLAALLGALYGIEGVAGGVFSAPYAIEIGYTAVLSPILFALLKLIGPLHPDRRRGEGL